MLCHAVKSLLMQRILHHCVRYIMSYVLLYLSPIIRYLFSHHINDLLIIEISNYIVI